MSKDGFATFISDNLPGFNSLNGSGFFDMAGDWNDLDESNPANEDGFDDECFEVVRSANPASVKEDVYFCFSGDEDEDEDVMGGSAMEQSSRRDTTASQGVPRSCRQRSTSERPKGERKPRSSADGKRRQMRRSKTVNDGTDGKSVTSRRSQMRRIKSSDGATRKLNSMKQSSKRSDNLKKKSLDLGSKLNRLEAMKNAPEVVQGGRRLRSRASNNNLLTDEASVVSRGVQSGAGASVRRGGGRRRRASQQHDLLARNLQQHAKANDHGNRRSSTTDLKSKADAGGKEEVWRARRRRSVEATSLPMPAIAA